MPNSIELGRQRIVKVYSTDQNLPAGWSIPDGWRFLQIAAAGTDYLGEYHLVVIERA